MQSYTKSRKQKQGSKASKKWVLIFAAAVLVVTVVLAIKLFVFNTDKPKNQTTSDGINYQPPTKEDMQAVEDQKSEIVKNQENQSQDTGSAPSTSSKKSVTPIIVSAGREGVRGYVNGVIENGGTCTATFTQGSSTVRKTSIGFANATNTNCEPISLTASELGAGQWTIKLTYESVQSRGASGEQVIQ